MELVRTLRLATNDLEKQALETGNDQALENIDKARELINDIEKDLDELAKLGIRF